ncbi:uncharacterized protein LOC135214035 [Macrobrachium nipponense]|uniref:uncharacterized protein LOC135214035 n=1 Tax=Macrobrachium nipponense TaxID=159736 RepID=UPI0030C7E346
MRTALLFLVALAASALAGPAGQRNTCATHCKPSETFVYENGKSYTYEYSVTTSTRLLGAFDDDAQMHITAKAQIDVTSPCEYVLRLTEVQLQNSIHNAEFSEAIMKNPLRFSFQDGVVESLCSEATEPTWVLNFKRGLLSTFQNSMNNINHGEGQETDVAGMCVTQYSVTTEGNVISTERVKDLSSCAKRPDMNTYLMSTTYATDSPVQSLPIFKSTNKCQQKIEDGILKEAICEDTHKFRPFSSEEGGAITKATATMRLLSLEDLTVMIPDTQFLRKSLIFDEEISETSEPKVEIVANILNDLEVASQGEIGAEVPALFSNLVASLKSLDYSQMSNIYSKIQEPRVKKFLVDAMPLVGTASAAGTLRDMFVNGELTEIETDLWFTSLAFLKNPTPEIFTAIAPLLEETPSQKAMLGTSALINNYCKLHSDCESETGIIQVLRRIEAQLGSSCRATNEVEKNKILVALKSLGNAGRWINANTVLKRCYTEEENDMEIRVAALEAWRHTPCEYDRSSVQAAFQDEKQDSEVRIAAYLALMSCPTQEIIDTVKDRLTSEGINQVTSFVWTHMTNLQESASPEKQWLHDMIGEELLQLKYNKDALKFSRNYESSFFMNELNLGATVESNMIFSGKSYLPRSAMLNLTLDLFGESINFFEVGGRIEGFETYVERFFGPNGYFHEETIEAILKNMREQKTDYEATTLEGILDKATDEAEGSYYMRVFGNELHYHHFRGLENFIETSGTTNPLEFLMDMARKGNVDYSKSYQMFDTHYIIPTASGLPLAVTAKGTATLGIQVNGKFNIQNMKNVDIEGHINPSAAVEINGLMAVDAHVTRTGLKIKSNLHTSTFLDGKIKINKGKVIDIAFNIPKEKVEVINVQTKFFYLENDEETEKGIENKMGHESCTSGITGMALCGEFSYTPKSEISPAFPFAGPFGTHVYLKKMDTHTGYVLQFKNAKNEIYLLADTPGSQSNHKIEMSLKKSNNAIALDIQTPFKSIQGTGEYIWQKNNKNAKLTLTLDGEQYGMDASLITDSKARKVEPLFVLTAASGTLVNLKGLFEMTGKSAEGNLELKTPYFETEIKSTFNYDTKGLISLTTDADYIIGGGEKQTIHQLFLIKKEISDATGTYTLNFDFIPSECSDISTSLNYQAVVKRLGEIEGTGKLVFGPATWETAHSWLLTSESGLWKLDFNLGLKCPQRGIDYLASTNLSFNQNDIQGNVLLRTVPGKDLSLSTSLSRNEDIELKGNIAVQVGDFKAASEVMYSKISSEHHKIQLITKIGDETCMLEGAFENKSTSGKINAILSGICKCSGYDINTNFGIYADTQKASVDMTTKVNGRDYTAKIEGSSSSLLIDVDIIKHVVLNTQVTSTDDVAKLIVSAEWDKDVDPTKALAIAGEISPSTIHLNLKFLEKEFLLSSKLESNGVQLEAKWDADQRILCTITYKHGETISLGATLLTPFPGWEKQDTTFTLSLDKTNVDSRFIVTWKNSELISLSVNANLQPGALTNALKAAILFSSSLTDFERVSFTVEHSMVNARISSKIEGNWNEKQLKGNFELVPTEDGIEGHLSLTAPFMERILINMKHSLTEQALDSIAEMKFGEETLTASAKGHIVITQVHDVAMVLKIDSSLPVVPAINTNVNYKNDGSLLKLTVEGKMGDQKMMLDLNGSIVKEDTTNIKGELRFITPFTYPLTASVKHQHTDNAFTSELEMSRIWSTFGNLKVHAEGQMTSKSDIKLSAYLSSPDNKASLTFNHKVAERHMLSSVSFLLNGETIKGSVSGVVDDASNLVDLEAEVTSTLSEIDDIKMKVKSQKTDNTRTSNVTLIKGSKSVTIAHVISVQDLLNWENSFNINGVYILTNKQTHVGTKYTHEFQLALDSQEILGALEFDKKSTGDFCEVDTKLRLVSQWTGDVKGELQLKYNDVEYNPVIIIEYSPGKRVELSNTIKINDAFYYLETSLVTPFWDTLGLKLNVDFKPRPAVTLVIMKGSAKTTIDVSGSLESKKLEGQLEIISSYLTYPFSMEVTYDTSAEQKTAHLGVVYDKKYEIKGVISGSAKAAKWVLTTDLPFETIQHLQFSGGYDIMKMPLSANTVFILNTKKYELEANVDFDSFTVDFAVDDNKGKFSGNWFYSMEKANVNIIFESPLAILDSFSVEGMYDLVSEKKVSIKFTKGAQELSVTGKLENETLLINAVTPFSDWENLEASFFISESAIAAFARKNEAKIEINGALHVKPGKGKINLIISSPFAGLEQISVDLSYLFRGPTKTVQLKSTFGTQQILLNGSIDIANILSPEMKLDIATPFETVNKLGGLVKWNFETATKTAIVNIYHNDNRYSWELEATADSLLKGNAKTKLQTPFSGWTSCIFEGNFDFSSLPFKFTVTCEKEGHVKTFNGLFTFNKSEFSAELATPIPEWEKIVISGSYTFAEDLLTFSSGITKSADNYALTGNILFNSLKPKLNVSLKTPITYASNIDFTLDADLIDNDKKFLVSLNIDETLYSLEINGQYLQKQGFLKVQLQSPIPGFKTLELFGKINFTGDIKVAELDIKKEGQTQHLSIAAQVNDNNLRAEIQTPFVGFESLEIQGDYIVRNGEHIIEASYIKNLQKYAVKGILSTNDMSAILKISTPVETMKNIEIKANFSLLNDGFDGSLHFEKDQEFFELKSTVGISPLKSNIIVSFETPVSGWRKLLLDAKYDVQSEKKSASITVEKDSVVKKISIEGSFTLRSGLFKVETPVEGFSVFGAEYNLNINEENNQLHASVKIYNEGKEWTFVAQGEYHSDRIMIKFQTPFEGFNTIAAEGSINFDSRAGKVLIEFGTYKFTVDLSYATDNLLFKITTPFEDLKVMLLEAKYTWLEALKDVTISLTYNEMQNTLHGVLNLSKDSSEILVKVVSPFQGLGEISVNAKYDVNNRDELMFVRVITSTQTYAFKMGGYIEEKVAALTLELNTPFEGLQNVKFSVKLDLTSEDKHLEIIMDKDSDVKAIIISGKLIGEMVDFNLKSPFAGFHDFKVFGALNRPKRSLEFQMMSDDSAATFAANFNSLTMEVKTPFAAANQIKWEIVKVDENTIKAEWRRNDNYVSLVIEKQGRKAAFNLKVESMFQGWELLAIAGQLDQETISGYIRGQLNEDKMSVSGSGQFDTKGALNLNIQTPYDNYKSVEVTLEYNIRKKTAKLEASSSSSDFHFILERGRSGVIHHHSIFPHSEQPTEISLNLGLYSGKATVTSRYPLLRNYYQEYNANIGPDIKIDHIIKWNDLEVFKLDVVREGANKKLDVEVHFRRTGHHTTIELHRDGYSSLNFLARRDDQEFTINVQGSGNLPTQGTLDIDINNSFREVPRNIKATATIDVQPGASRKNIKLEVVPSRGKLYIFDLHYSMDISNPKQGDFTLSITTPDRMMAPWKNISGSWNLEDQSNTNIRFKVGDTEYTAQGMLTLRESTLVLVPSDSSAENIYLQWTFRRDGNGRDYFIKIGRESRYHMVQLKGTILDYAHVDVEGAIKNRFMEHELHFKTKWNKQADGTVQGEGSFEYGKYHSEHTVKFLRDPSRRSATFEASGTSNIPNYERVSLSGSYDFDGKVVINALVFANDRESKIEVNFTDLNPSQSRNTININIPLLRSYGQMELTLSHDFRQTTSKSFSAIARFADREAYLKANWNRSPNFETLQGNVDVKSKLVGEVHIVLNFDISNISDAHAEATYTRVTPAGQTKNASLKWTRQQTPEQLNTELVVDTPFSFLQHGRIFVNADFSKLFKVSAGIDYNEKHITLDLDVNKKSITGKITTPFENFELIDGSLTYNLGGKTKTVQLAYERGDRKVNLDFVLNVKPKKEGDFDLTLTTPFDFVKNLHIDGKWSKKNAAINYQRNDIVLNFQGKAEVKADKSSFDLSFVPPSGNPIRVAGSFDVEELIEGTGSSEKQIASLEVEFDGNRLSFNVNGFRNTERVYIEIDGKTTFAKINNFHLKVDTHLSTDHREGNIEVGVNEFELKIDNHFERKGSEGYYFKSHIESTLTPLPALIFGIGHTGEERIVTIGYGEDREITFSIKGKDNFESGFSGYVDIPNFGYEGVKYEVEYNFANSNEIHIDIEAELGGEGEIEGRIIYNAEGLQARLSSLITGAHSLRVRRSISSDGFFAEAGIDDYNLKLRGGFNNDDTKKGVLLEGEVFGRTFSIDALLQSEGLKYTEGKLIIKTPFQGWETIGGLFTWAFVDNKIISHAEVMLPSDVNPKITGEINLNLDKKVDGYVKLDLFGEEFTLKSNLVGTNLDGYKGIIEIYTPFHYLSYGSVSGNLKALSGFVETNLKIDFPLATHEVKVNFKNEMDKVTFNLDLQSTLLERTVSIGMELDRTNPIAVIAHLTINNNKISVEYTMQNNLFLVSIDSLVLDVPRKFSLEAKYESLDSLEGTIIAILGGETHKMHGGMNAASDRVQGIIEVESSLIEGTRKLSFDISMPTPFKQFSGVFVYTNKQSHSIQFSLDVISGIRSHLMIDTPLFPKVDVTVELTFDSANFTLITPQGTHKLLATWRVTRKTSVDYMANMELASPLLPVDYVFGVVIGGDKEKRTLQAELNAGGIKHLLEGFATMSNQGGSFSLNLETPISGINRATVEASVEFVPKIQIHITNSFANKVNTFDFNFDKENMAFMSAIESPFIPTGMLKAEAKITGEINKNMQLKINLMNNENSMSGVLNTKIASPQNIKVNLKITTPFKGFKKMGFAVQYLKNSEGVNVLLVAEKPVKFNVELRLGNFRDNIKADIKVDTEIKSFEAIEGHLLIPLNSFEPRISTGMMINGEYYKGHIGVKTKAPYELTYGLHLGSLVDQTFHLRTDSSFLFFL